MIRINSIRMVLEIDALINLKVHQMDVKIAFINGELYKKSTRSSLRPFSLRERKVYKLVKSLYRLKQAPKQ